MTAPAIRLYVSSFCVECERSVALLERHGLPFELVDVGTPESCCRLVELTGRTTAPQVVVDGRAIGGYEELAALVRRLGEERASSAASPMGPTRNAGTTGP